MLKTVILEQEVPSYLKEFIQEDIQCRLVFSQPSDVSTPLSPVIISCIDGKTDDRSYKDLNETPEFDPCTVDDVVSDGMLQIKLDESDLQIVHKSPPKSSTVQLTTEDNQFPLEENEARILLGTKFNNVQSEIPTFCIVKNNNGKHEQKLVVMGGQNTVDCIKSYAVFKYDVQDRDSLKWDRWEKLATKQQYASTEYNFRRIYNIYGAELEEFIDMEDDMASMVLETSWHEPVEDEPCFYQTNLKLKMHIVSGHPKSSIHFLWDELKQLETYLAVLDNESALQIGSTVISDNHSIASELVEKIHNLCTDPTKRRKNSILLSVDDLRELTILDRLWSILIRCKDLIDLKNSLSTFFRIANMENLVNRDRAVELVKDLDIQDYMVNLTFSESLKFLIAIGFEKLKNDYLAIVSFYNPIHQVSLEHLWSKYCVVKKPEIRRRSLAPNQIRYFALTDTTYNKEKMGLLSNLHDASEFVMFLKNNLMESIKLSDQNFSRISNEVYQKFVFDNEGNIDSEILTPNIVRITCDLDSRNEELYKNQIPLKKIYETKTRMHCNKINKDESIQTILVSSSPIFPETVCANNLAVEGEPSNKLENKSFVSIFKMTKFGLF